MRRATERPMRACATTIASEAGADRDEVFGEER